MNRFLCFIYSIKNIKTELTVSIELIDHYQKIIVIMIIMILKLLNDIIHLTGYCYFQKNIQSKFI